MYLNKIFKPTTGRTNKLTCWLISFLFSNRRMTLCSTAAQGLLLHHDRTEVWEHLWRGRTVTSPGVHVSAPYSQSRPEAKPTRPRCLWSRGTTRHWISVWESASAPLPPELLRTPPERAGLRSLLPHDPSTRLLSRMNAEERTRVLWFLLALCQLNSGMGFGVVWLTAFLCYCCCRCEGWVPW